MPALPDPVTRLPRNELLVIEIGADETPLDSRMPYRAALCRLFRSKSLPVRSVAAIAFAQGPRTVLSATTTLVPSRTRMAPRFGAVEGAVATMVFPITLSPSVPPCRWTPVPEPADWN